MGKLAEYLRTEADTIRATKAKHKAAVDDWCARLDALYGQMREWLTASDPDGLLEHFIEEVAANDPALGYYMVHVLKIRLDDRTVEVLPTARYVAARIRPAGQDLFIRPHGLVELKGRFGNVYYLYQSPDGTWYIQSEMEAMSRDGSVVERLDRDRFEAAVWALLQ